MLSFREFEAQLALKREMENRLFSLVVSNKTDDVKKLITEVEPKVNVNAQNEDAETPLMKAVRNNNHEMVKLLLEAKANPKIKDAYGAKARHYLSDSIFANESDRQSIATLLEERDRLRGPFLGGGKRG